MKQAHIEENENLSSPLRLFAVKHSTMYPSWPMEMCLKVM